MRSDTKTITRADLQRAVQRVIGGSRQSAGAIVEDVLEEVMQTLARGEDVSLQSFGVLFVRTKREHIVHNLLSRRDSVIPARRVLQFRYSRILLHRLNRTS